MMGELKQFRKGKTKWLSNVACDDFSVCTIRIITKNLNHLNLCNNVRFCKHHCSCNITVYSFYCFLLQYASDCTKYTVTVSIQLYTLFHCIISFIWWIICILFTLFLIYHHFYHFIETVFFLVEKIKNIKIPQHSSEKWLESFLKWQEKSLSRSRVFSHFKSIRWGIYKNR